MKRSYLITAALSLAVIAASVTWRFAGDAPPPAKPAPKPFKLKAPSAVTPSASESPSPPSDTPPSGLQQFLSSGILPEITLAQLQNYLRANQRNAKSLLAAYQLTKDASLLNEALARFPNDPRVQMLAAFATEENSAERLETFTRMMQAAPDNALPCYLAADQALALGDTDRALQMLTVAEARGALNDYLKEQVTAREEAMVSAGIPALEAKAAAIFGASMEHISPLMKLSRSMQDLAEAYAKEGNAESRQSMIELMHSLGQRIETDIPSTLLNDLAALTIRSRALGLMASDATLQPGGPTAAAMLEEAQLRRREIGKLTRSADPAALLTQPALLAQFLDRVKLFGERHAQQWLAQQLGPRQPP